MRVFFLMAMLLFISFPLNISARTDEGVAAALTADTVEVTANFAGARLSLYGAIDRAQKDDTDIVVVVYGPLSKVRVAQKDRVLGLWVDTDPVVFEGVPGYYMAASSQPLEDIVPFALRRFYQLGPSHLRLRVPSHEQTIEQFGLPVVVSDLGAAYETYRQALIRLMSREQLYNLDPAGVRFLDGGLFRADVQLPARAPTGDYLVSVYAFQNGQLYSKRSRVLAVNRVGLERMIYDAAHQHGWIYGAFSVTLAVVFGLGATLMSRRRWL